MSIGIRLARHGQRNRPFYRIVVAQTSARRDGKFIEVVGTYNPLTKPSTVTIKEERIKYWLSQGANPSERVAKFIKELIPGHLEGIEENRKSKLQAKRKARKARIAANKKAA